MARLKAIAHKQTEDKEGTVQVSTVLKNTFFELKIKELDESSYELGEIYEFAGLEDPVDKKQSTL